jgi:hypothetical protein
MKRDEMFAIAQRELAHIPKGDYPQGALRSTYWIMRLNSLGKHSEFPNDPQDLLERAIKDVRQVMPSASLDYDHDFFGRLR